MLRIPINNINERLQKVPNGDVFTTDYIGDIVKLFLNKPKVYRFSYLPKLDIYAVGDAYKYEHGNLIYCLREYGGYDIVYEDSQNNAMFCPYDEIDNSEDWDAGFNFGVEYPYSVPIETGYILTFNKSSLQNDFRELYTYLNKHHLILKDHKYINSEGRLYPEYGLSNNDLYNTLLCMCDGYLDGRVKKLYADTIEEQIEMLRNLLPVVDFSIPVWRPITMKELDELEKKMLVRQKELSQN
jgi:hypothetical protein